MVRFDIWRTMVWDMSHFMNTLFSGLSGCHLNTLFCGIIMILQSASLLLLGLQVVCTIGRTFQFIWGIVFYRFIGSVAPFAPCSARSSGLGCSGPCASMSSQPGAAAERAVCKTDTTPCTKGSGLLGFWTSIPPAQGVRPLRVSQCLCVVLRPVLIAGIVVYQSILRPSMFGSCRFYPTCSTYAINAFHHHGLMTAMILILWRIIRCNPWGPCGYDPVPSSLFSSS